METAVPNPIEVGKNIVDIGFMVVTSAGYLVYSAIIIFFFVKWFVRIVNGIIKDQQQILNEMLLLLKKMYEIIKSLE